MSSDSSKKIATVPFAMYKLCTNEYIYLRRSKPEIMHTYSTRIDSVRSNYPPPPPLCLWKHTLEVGAQIVIRQSGLVK